MTSEISYDGAFCLESFHFVVRFEKVRVCCRSCVESVKSIVVVHSCIWLINRWWKFKSVVLLWT